MLILLDLACIELRKVQSTKYGLLQEKIRNLPADIFRDLALGFHCGCAKVRSCDEILFLKKWGTRVGLRFEDVERGACDLTGLQGLPKVLLVNNPSAGAVHQSDSVLHPLDRRVVDQVAGLFSQRNMERNEIRLFPDLLQTDKNKPARE